MIFKRSLAIALLLFLPPCAAQAERLNRGLGPEPDSLDIHQAQGLPAIHLLREIREGLFTIDAASETAPGVAADWSVAADGQFWRFALRPDGGLNRRAYTNPDYDRLLDQAGQLGGSDRLTALGQAHSLLMRDTPVIPLYYYVSRHLVKPGVNGFIDNVRDIHLSRYLDIDTQSE